jgi:hypothetical protein
MKKRAYIETEYPAVAFRLILQFPLYSIGEDSF